MKLTIYAKTSEELAEKTACFLASYKAVNFLEERDTWPMQMHIPWREGHHEPSTHDPNRYDYYAFLEI